MIYETKPKKVKGFEFDTNTFEDLLDNFTPMEDVHTILGITEADLDVFCKRAYGMNYKETYNALMSRAMFYNRKAFNILAKKGNQTAMNIVAKNFMKLEEEQNNAGLKIEVVGGIPLPPREGNGGKK